MSKKVRCFVWSMVWLGCFALPPEIRGSDFSFAVIGHVRPDTGDMLSPQFLEAIELLKRIKPDFLIMTGDTILGDCVMGTCPDRETISLEDRRADVERQWEAVDGKLNELGIDVYRVPGNHDVHNELTKGVFLSRYGKFYQAFTHQDNRFVLLCTVDTERKGNPWGVPFDEEQWGFFRREAEGFDKHENVFAFGHQPPFYMNNRSTAYNEWWWREVHPLMKAQVKYAFFGNSNAMYLYEEKDGVGYVVNGLNAGYKWEDDPILPHLDTIDYIRVRNGNVIHTIYALGGSGLRQVSMGKWNQYYDLSRTGDLPLKEKGRATSPSLFSRVRWRSFFAGAVFSFLVLIVGRLVKRVTKSR